MTKTTRATRMGANPLTSVTLPVNWLESELPDPKDQREYAQERCIVAITEALGAAMERASINRTELAKKLGVSKSHVSQLFAGRNLTLRTIGDVLWACGLEVNDIEVAPLGVSFVPAEQACEWVQQYSSSHLTTSEPTSSLNVSVRSPGAYEPRRDATWLAQLNPSVTGSGVEDGQPESAPVSKQGMINSNMALAA